MYRNQYFITSNNVQNKADFKIYTIDKLYIHVHENLDFFKIKKQKIEICILGIIIDPLNPTNSNENVIENLLLTSYNVETFLKEIQQFTGRYILIYKNVSDFILIGDACHLRRILYSFDSDSIDFTSSEKLYLDFTGLTHTSNKEKQKFITNSDYIKNEEAWFGEDSIDDSLKKLLPNHYYDIHLRKAIRTPIFWPDNINSENDRLNYANQILTGTYQALLKRYKIWQPITAGLDSRLLLAASKKYKDNIQYYIFDHWKSNHQDVIISQRLSKKLDLNFKIIETIPLEEKFLSVYKKHFLYPRIMGKTSQIQYHYYKSTDKNIINVNGNGLEIAKAYFGYTKKKITLKMILVFSGYSSTEPFLKSQIENWYSTAAPFSIKYGINMLDLFYWEQRMGNWGAVYPYEQDIAIDEISPFNNKNLILILLMVKGKDRKSPQYLFYKKLIKLMWEDLLTEPINPKDNYLKKLISSNSYLKYRLKLIKSFLKSFL